jgi:hypothetical protein
MLAIVGDVVLAAASLVLVSAIVDSWWTWRSDVRRRREAGIR